MPGLSDIRKHKEHLIGMSRRSNDYSTAGNSIQAFIVVQLNVPLVNVSSEVADMAAVSRLHTHKAFAELV